MAININGTGSITGLSSLSSPTISGGSLPAGSASAPGLVFSGDSNTGIYSPGADQLAISTNGTGRLFVDANGNVGVGGNASTSANLRVVGLTGRSIIEAYGADADGFADVEIKSTGASGASRLYFSDTAAQSGSIRYSHNTNSMEFSTTGSERMRLTSGGSLGIGTTSPVNIGAGYTGLTINGSSGGTLYMQGGGTSGGRLLATNTDFYIGTVQASGSVIFQREDGSYESARIDSSGRLLVGTSTTSQSSGNGVKINPAGQVWCVSTGGDTFSAYNGGYKFYVDSSGVIAATSATITVISDQRFKKNIRDLDDGLDKILALQPRKFDWKEGRGNGEADERGFIAQEFEQVFPDLINEWKDEAPEGEEPYKAVRADLIPVLVKAIQEQQAMITELQTKVAALEGV